MNDLRVFPYIGAWILPILTVLTCQAQADTSTRPNIIVIYADDLGFGDVQCYNPIRGRIATPHIDDLARRGMRFTDAHSSSAVCSPSRYTLLTGRYHWRTRLQRGIVGLWEPPLIAPDRMTIGSLAQEAGYRTACIGKWHLGWSWPIPAEEKRWFDSPRGAMSEPKTATVEQKQSWQRVFSQPIPGGPRDVGFDAYFGTDVPNWPPYTFIENDRVMQIPTQFADPELFQKNMGSLQGPAVSGWRFEPILPALVDRVVDMVERESKTPEPFLIYFPLTSPHTPLAVNRDWKGRSGLNRYADFVMETDAMVGRVVEAVRRAGISHNTLILFTSDNGCAHYVGAKSLERQSHFPSGPLRGYKSDAWEGGHRVPFIVCWPERVQPGQTCTHLVHQADLLATLGDIMKTPLPGNAGEDSFSFLPLLLENQNGLRHNAVSTSIRGVPAVRQGNWKYIPSPGSGGWSSNAVETDGPDQLYNLATDLGEQLNLAGQEPERVKSMQFLLEALITRGRSTEGPPARNDVRVQRHAPTSSQKR